MIARVVVSEKRNDLFNDPMAVLCLERLIPAVSEEDQRWIIREKRIFSGSQRLHAIAGVRRVKFFDDAVNRFIAANLGRAVINLACGFDTRFWRIANQNCSYIEIDLPEVVALKRAIFGDQLGYELVGCSVLDPSWIDQVTINGNSHFLLLAEGLFCYLPEPDVKGLFQRLAQKFACSQLVLDIIPQSYTRGLLKKLFSLETRINWGMDIPWVFGIKHPRDIESYAPGLRVLGYQKASGGPIITVSINATDSA